MNREPLLSICCLAYNHEKFISQTIDGFLKQKTDFPIEIIIHDDASTDGTADVIKSYQQKYPEIIKPIFQNKNQYSTGISVTSTYLYPKARGKYIALCEGDDYWTYSSKLQEQVDFLENNEDYSVITHKYSTILGDNKTTVYDEFKDNPHLIGKKYVDYDLKEFFENFWSTPLTMVFKKEIVDLETLKKYKKPASTYLSFHLLTSHMGRFLNEDWGMYRRHAGGVHSSISKLKQAEWSVIIYKELFEKNTSFRKLIKPYYKQKVVNYNKAYLETLIENRAFLKMYFYSLVHPVISLWKIASLLKHKAYKQK